MAVHAHPDDEAISTGGILARYSDEGIRTVLVTCTDGGCGDGPGGLKPGDAGFDRDAVVKAREAELSLSCQVLGITHQENLGYPDSGMMGWATNDAPGSFWTTPLDEAAERLAELMKRYRPDVVVTYDANGFYGHPDHIQAHRITMAAAETTGIPAKLYYTAVPRSRLIEFGRRLREIGLAGEVDPEEAQASMGTDDFEGPREEWGTPDEEVTTFVDVSGVIGRKWDSLKAHASQSDNLLFLKMGREMFGEAMGSESFVRVEDRTGAAVPENDLFAGLR